MLADGTLRLKTSLDSSRPETASMQLPAPLTSPNLPITTIPLHFEIVMATKQ